MNSGDLTVTDSKMNSCIDKMMQLLSELNIHGVVCTELLKIKRENVDINYRETELKALRDVLHQLVNDLDTVQATLSSVEDAHTQQRKDLEKVNNTTMENADKVVTLENDFGGLESKVKQLTELCQKVKSFLANNPDINGLSISGSIQAIEKTVMDMESKVEKNPQEIWSQIASIGEEMRGIKRKLAETDDKTETKKPAVLEEPETSEDIMKAWNDIETELLEELDPTYILSFNFISENERQVIRQKKTRREMVERFLLRVKENLPGAFSVLLHALKDTGKENVACKLKNMILGKNELKPMAHVSNMSSIKIKVSVMTKDGSSHNAEIKLKDNFERGSSVFSSDLCSIVIDVKRGSVIIHLQPLSKHAQETLAFFCQHGGMKDFVLNLLRKKDLFASLPVGDVHIEVEVSCHNEDMSEGAHKPQQDFISERVEVVDNPQVIKQNLLLQYGTLLEEIDPINLQEAFLSRKILEKSFFEELKDLRRRESAACFLNKVLHIGNDALEALVQALKDSGRVNLATNLCCVEKKTSDLGDTEQVDDTLVQVVGAVSQMHSDEAVLWSCRLDLLIGSTSTTRSTQSRFDDKEYTNWIKCRRVFTIFKEGLHDFIKTEVKKFHAQIQENIANIPCGSSVSSQCGICTWKSIKHREGQQDVWYINCQNKICDKWMSQILLEHNDPHNHNINWKNADISKWPIDGYEVAKVYMPKGQEKAKNLPDDFNAPMILSLFKYCVWFTQKIQTTSILSDLIDFWNEIIHSGDLRVTDSKMNSCIESMIQLMSELNIHGDVCTELQKTKKDTDINFRETEVKALHNLVSSIKEKMDSLQDAQTQQMQDIEKVKDNTTETEGKVVTMETVIQGVKLEVEPLSEIYQKIKPFLANNPDIHDNNLSENRKAMEKTITALKSKFEKKRKEIGRRITSMVADISGLKKGMKRKFKETEEKHQEIETKMTLMGTNIGGIKNGIKRRFKVNEEENQEIKTKITSMGKNISGIQKEIERKFKETAAKHKEIKKKIILLGRNVRGIKKEVKRFTRKPNIEKDMSDAQEESRPETDGLRQLKNQTEDKLNTL